MTTDISHDALARAREALEAAERTIGKFQELVINVRGWVSRGYSEAATDAMRVAMEDGWASMGWKGYLAHHRPVFAELDALKAQGAPAHYLQETWSAEAGPDGKLRPGRKISGTGINYKPMSEAAVEMAGFWAEEYGRIEKDAPYFVVDGLFRLIRSPQPDPTTDPRYPALLADAEAGQAGVNLDGTERRGRTPEDYERCSWCGGSGLALNSAGEPDVCPDCGGDTMVLRALQKDPAR